MYQRSETSDHCLLHVWIGFISSFADLVSLLKHKVPALRKTFCGTLLLLPIRHFQSVRSPPRSEQHLSLSSMLQLVHGIHLARARDWCRFQVESNLNPFLISIHSLPPSPRAEFCDILLKPCKLDFESFPRLGQPARGMTGTDHLEFTFVRIVRQN